jgi:hypothetical protein
MECTICDECRLDDTTNGGARIDFETESWDGYFNCIEDATIILIQFFELTLTLNIYCVGFNWLHPDYEEFLR